jgi:putative transposase
MMQAVGRSYVQYFNRKQQRTGTLWEGRYRSTVLETERYLLQCMAYIELNPVRAGMVAGPQDYPWSSYAHYIGQRADPLVSPHPLYWEMGNTPFAREAAYQAWVQAGVDGSAQQALTDATLRGWALGEADFVADLQKRTDRRISKSKAGRPSRATPVVP